MDFCHDFFTGWETSLADGKPPHHRGNEPMSWRCPHGFYEEGCLVCLRAEIEHLRTALDKSVTLQTHYAGLLNDYDGGRRLLFTDGEHWMARLRSLEPASQRE